MDRVTRHTASRLPTWYPGGVRLTPLVAMLVAVGCAEPQIETPPPLPPPPGLGPIVVLDIEPDSASVPVGDTVRFQVVSVNNAPPERVAWAISDTLLATIDSLGLATARRSGEAVIRATASRGNAVGYVYAGLRIR